jgi:hypothetical protein
MTIWTRLLPITLLSFAVACGGGEGDDSTGDGDGGGSGGDGGGNTDAAVAIDAAPSNFSFFVTSLATMRSQSGSQDGFGGNLGGLAGADQICQTAAAAVGAGDKTWRAFLSTYNNGNPIHAIDRIGTGPWYDKNGRLIAMNLAGLTSGDRPAGDAQTVNDLPDEHGTPLTTLGDSHDVMTGSTAAGRFDGTSAVNTCNDWTNSGAGTQNAVRCGHSWPALSGNNWIRAHQLRGCSPGVNLVQNGPGTGTSVGAGGGWGGIYCFALTP